MSLHQQSGKLQRAASKLGFQCWQFLHNIAPVSLRTPVQHMLVHLPTIDKIVYMPEYGYDKPFKLYHDSLPSHS